MVKQIGQIKNGNQTIYHKLVNTLQGELRYQKRVCTAFFVINIYKIWKFEIGDNQKVRKNSKTSLYDLLRLRICWRTWITPIDTW